LVEPGGAYALYPLGGTKAELILELPAGSYKAQWLETKAGRVCGEETFAHTGGDRTLNSPKYAEDVALRIKRQER
jgi:hypothetical protein